MVLAFFSVTGVLCSIGRLEGFHFTFLRKWYRQVRKKMEANIKLKCTTKQLATVVGVEDENACPQVFRAYFSIEYAWIL